MEGDLESIVAEQMDGLEKSNSQGNLSEKISLRLYEFLWLAETEIMLLWVCERVKGLGLGEYSFRPGVTLCSLSVRMDN